MKTLLICLATLLFASTAYAGNPAKIGFRMYSTAAASPAQCAVFGMLKNLARDDQGIPIQAFAPNPSLSRTYNLGTKGMANYSTNAVRAIQFTCRLQPLLASTASTAVRVKVFMNGVETHFLTMSEGTIFIGQ